MIVEQPQPVAQVITAQAQERAPVILLQVLGVILFQPAPQTQAKLFVTPVTRVAGQAQSHVQPVATGQLILTQGRIRRGKGSTVGLYRT
ncbi:hypothetical protein D3C84_1038910 [compost metagenome]